MELFNKAIFLATRAHNGDKRKCCSLPYIVHPMEAAVIVASMTEKEEVLCAAMLHDVVEDAGITIDEIRAEFGERIAFLVASETEDKREHMPAQDSWMLRKQEAVDHLRACDDIDVKMLYLGDKLSNLRSMYRGWQLEGDAFWNHFHQKDPEKHHWYYRSIANAISDLSGYLAWKELDRLIVHLFNEETAKEHT